MPIELRSLSTITLKTTSIMELEKYLRDISINLVYITKIDSLLPYDSITINYSDNTSAVINKSSTLEDKKSLRFTDMIDIVIISGSSTRYFNAAEIYSLGGFKLICPMQIAIEYYKYRLKEILYSSNLIQLCSRNPLDSLNTGIDYTELYDFVTDELLEDFMIDLEEQVLDLDIKLLISEDITRISNRVSGYELNLKELYVLPSVVSIRVLDDIRSIRFEEMVKIKGGRE